MVRELAYKAGRCLDTALASDPVEYMIEIASCAIRKN